MKILILSASIGSGHTKAAESIEKVLNHEVLTVDFMSKEISTLNWLTKKIYLAALKLIPDLYDRIYNFAGVKQSGIFVRLLTSAAMYFPFTKIIKKFRPDVVICTHPFPEAAASLWKFLHAKSAENFLLVAVLTDYSLHEIWIYSEVDIYFTATEKMKSELAENCRQNQEIHAVGIPIGQEFLTADDENFQTARDSHEFTILMMGGGLGLGSIEETLMELENISAPLKILVVAGQNEKLLSRLKNFQSKHNLEILGYVENICGLMKKSDLLITKPGALTMTEAFAAGLPMILHAPIPGPETKNAEYAVKNGAAISADKKISEIVEKFLENPSRLSEMSLNAKNLSKVNAAADIAKIILETKKESRSEF
ncbi:MAG: glycosyltransferase [Selenomonadaceae bacterium]|nr:glycosyltransferase [Selenomonadaceae bacterium]